MSRSCTPTRPFHLVFRTTPTCSSRTSRPWIVSCSSTASRSRNTGLRRHQATAPALQLQPSLSRSFTTAHTTRKGLQRSTAYPEHPRTSPSSSSFLQSGNAHTDTQAQTSIEPTALSNETYHELADSYLDRLVSVLEEKAETNAEYEVEYSAGVLSIELPQGTWIINKQPPNKQIWLSSPVSGPKRYDYVATTAAADGQTQKEGTTEGAVAAVDYEDGRGRWVYLRDGSGLSDLLREEVGVVVPPSSS